MIHSRIKSPSVPLQGMQLKVLERYILTGCIFCAPSGLRQGQGFTPPPEEVRHPRPNESRVLPPPPDVSPYNLALDSLLGVGVYQLRVKACTRIPNTVIFYTAFEECISPPLTKHTGAAPDYDANIRDHYSSSKL